MSPPDHKPDNDLLAILDRRHFERIFADGVAHAREGAADHGGDKPGDLLDGGSVSGCGSHGGECNAEGERR